MDSIIEASPHAPPDTKPFAPVADDQRIQALDVVRGFALLGIFLMNIEWFNRPFASFNEGMPRGLTGLDWLASWFVAYFVQGKFWTIFSLLFGMGFAVMLVRAERAGREFVRVYLRRILALAVFGAVHYLFVWNGDILFSYAVGALALLIVLYGKPRPIMIACAALIAIGAVLDTDQFFRIATGLAMCGLLALYLRSERHVVVRGRPIPIFCFILLLAGVATSIGAVVFWLLPDGPLEPRVPMTVLGPMLLVTGWLSWRYRDPVEKRGVRMAVALYVFGGVVMTAISLGQSLAPDPEAEAVATDAKPAVVASAAAPKADASGAKPKLTRAQRVAEAKAEREKRLVEKATEQAEEVRILTRGSYREMVAWHGREFIEKATNDFGFAVILVAMFLLGMGFVRSGVMSHPEAHLAFFRKLALYALPFGIGLGVLSGLIATSHTPGERYDGWGIARGLVMLGNLPACVGYVGLVVTMLYSRGPWSRIRVLAPVGRMALTSYLTQTVLCTFFFLGFGLGQWGMPRAEQVVFVVAVYALQVAFSHWWLARFRYGPMEWLWRGFTYREVPPFRVGPPQATTPGAVA